MYLRKNTVRCGDARRTYLSIAHNVWLPTSTRGRGGSRPVCIASFGLADRIDRELARELVDVVERCAPRLDTRKGQGRLETMRIAREIRSIEPFLRKLASVELDLRAHLPVGPGRGAVLESLVRRKLASPEEEPSLDHLIPHARLAG